LELYGHLANGFGNTTGVNIITIIAGVCPGPNGQGEAMNVQWYVLVSLIFRPSLTRLPQHQHRLRHRRSAMEHVGKHVYWRNRWFGCELHELGDA
jgi:hypothetical protein